VIGEARRLAPPCVGLVAARLRERRWWRNDEAYRGTGKSAGVLTCYITVLVVHVQAVTQPLPFVMGVSVSRRTSYLGTALVAVENAPAAGERDELLDPGPLRGRQPRAAGVRLRSTDAGFRHSRRRHGHVHKRRGQAGTWGLIIASMVVSGGLANWFTDQSTATLTIGLPPAIALIAALASYPGIRRVVP
jgi:hypothetical protein